MLIKPATVPYALCKRHSTSVAGFDDCRYEEIFMQNNGRHAPQMIFTETLSISYVKKHSLVYGYALHSFDDISWKKYMISIYKAKRT